MLTAIRRAFSFFPSQDGAFTLPLICEKQEGFGFSVFSYIDMFQAQLTVVDGDALWQNRRIMGLPMKEYVNRQLNDAIVKLQRSGIEPKKLSQAELTAAIALEKSNMFETLGLRLDSVKRI